MNLSSMGTWNPTFVATGGPTPIEVGAFRPDRPSLQEIMASLPVIEKDPNGVDQHAPGAKLDAGKLQPWLFLSGFANALEKVAEVTTVGAQKYTRNGWKDVDNGQERYMEAFGRHLLAYGQGKEIDDGPKGTECLHISQMIWNLLAVLELQLRDKK